MKAEAQISIVTTEYIWLKQFSLFWRVILNNVGYTTNGLAWYSVYAASERTSLVKDVELLSIHKYCSSPDSCAYDYRTFRLLRLLIIITVS